MPVYEYRCEDCGKKFDIVASIKEKEAGLKPTCPNCGGIRVNQVFGRFTVIGGSKTESDIEDFESPPEKMEEEGFDEFGEEGMDEFGEEEMGEEELGEFDEELENEE